jgi:3-oxoacyl-[acyl-carrier protein] reductase
VPTPDPAPPLTGRIAAVTGAAAGIGRAIVLRLLRDGALIVAVDIDGRGLDALVHEPGVDGARITSLTVDVADEAMLRDALAGGMRRFGPIDILVNVAGIGGHGTFLELTPSERDRVLDVHVRGTMAATHAVVGGMVERGWGRIVTMLSDGVWHGRTTVHYTTAKGALLGFTRALAREVAASGVRVNAVAPGPVETAMLLDDPADVIEAERATVPIGRFLQPDEVAMTVAFLCGPGGDAYTGQVLAPNGGTVFVG